MADATYAIPNFLGGAISPFAQGRFDKPDYRTSLNVCLNAFPLEIGTWSRRPGTRHAGTTRNGLPGRVMKFDFEQDSAVTLEFTDGYLRFRSGYLLVDGNDPQEVVSISAADPAVVQTGTNHGWSTDYTVRFGTAIGEPLLLPPRLFLITVTGANAFSLRDAITGETIDGSTLGAITGSAGVFRIHELVTTYVGGSWADIRAVQAEAVDILLTPGVPPQALTIEFAPVPGFNPVFAIEPAVFNDGPYLDPFTNGVRATPGAKVGIISLALDFPAYSATKAYREGDFTTTGGVNYISLADQNVNHAPAAGAPWWATTSAGAAINDGRGFLGSDVGRLVRLFSEPAAWDVATAYLASTAAIPVVVAYNPSGVPGATVYYEAIAASTGKVPGTDLVNWKIVPSGAAIWSWGRITSLSNTIDRALAGSTNIGNMTSGGGLVAAFDGVYAQTAAASATLGASGGAAGAGSIFTLSTYVGKDYSLATDQAIEQATVYPSSDRGFAYGTYDVPDSKLGGVTWPFIPSMVFNLRGKATLPASASDGTLLGTSGSILNSTASVTVVSGDQATAWKYVWMEQVSSFQIGGVQNATSYTYAAAVAELSLFSPSGTGTSAGANMEILGPPLLYTTAISTWRLGVYSDTTGYPTCGTYDGGRIWLGGAVPNRLDACMSNGHDGGTLDFAPTDQNGVVAANNAITYTLNSDSANPMFWMQAEEKGITIGTQAGEFLVLAPTTGPISPLNITARRVTRHGCADIEPRRTEHTLVFVKRYARKLLEFFSDANFGKFSAPNLADKAGHIVSAGIAEIAYTEAVTPVIWGRDEDGALFGITYKRDTLTTSQPPTFYAWHRHTLGSGRTVESICNGPSVGGDLDTLTMVTRDPDSGVHHVELLTDTPDENTALTAAWFLDNAVSPTSTSSTSAASVGAPDGGLTINGLWHLNGETVQVFAGGLDCGDRGPGTTGFTDFLVTDGSCFVPFGDSISSGPGRGLFTAAYIATFTNGAIPLVVGLTYNSDGQMVRPIAPADTGARTGPALGKTRRQHRYAALLSGTFGISFGTTFDATNLKPALLKKANGDPIAALTTYSGVHTDVLTDAGDGYDSMACWRVSRPWPANLVAFEGFIQSQDR